MLSTLSKELSTQEKVRILQVELAKIACETTDEQVYDSLRSAIESLQVTRDRLAAIRADKDAAAEDDS